MSIFAKILIELLTVSYEHVLAFCRTQDMIVCDSMVLYHNCAETVHCFGIVLLAIISQYMACLLNLL